MATSFVETRRGYCPEFGDDNHAIKVRFLQVETLGGIKLETCDSVECQYFHSCNYVRTNRYCPLISQFARK